MSDTKQTTIDSDPDPDPFKVSTEQSNAPKDGEFVLLHFSDNRQVFAEVLTKWRGKNPPLKINKRNYDTSHLVGLPYGTVLELNNVDKKLIPLEDGAGLIPDEVEGILEQDDTNDDIGKSGDESDKNNKEEEMKPILTNTTKENTTHAGSNDNRHLTDSNTSQLMSHDELAKLREDPTISGSQIVAKIIQNSSTFQNKTNFSKAKYIHRKQVKYQPRCRLVRCTGSTIAQALFLKDPKKVRNLREDTLAQIVSYANICAGRRVLLMDECMGLLTGAVAERMGGYGYIVNVFCGHSPPFIDMIARFNLSFLEYSSIKWLHAGEVFHDDDTDDSAEKGKDDVDNDNADVKKESETAMDTTTTSSDTKQHTNADQKEEEGEIDYELRDRNQLHWPCPLQSHTNEHLLKMTSDTARKEFLSKRSSRFARKLTRPTMIENRTILQRQKCDSLILACRYDPTATLLNLLPYLEPSCPFVIYSEYLEPLLDCFRTVQSKQLGLNLKLTDTWMRDYQVLPGRTHPNMSMSQNGGFILTGVKLDEEFGINDMDEDVRMEIKKTLGGRRIMNGGRGRKRKAGNNGSNQQNAKKGC